MKYIKKDITTVEGPAIIIHGVNCQGVMGSGVAKALYTKWPGVKAKYLSYTNAFFTWPWAKADDLLGNVNYIDVGIDEDIRIYNLYSQENYGKDGRVYANPLAIAHGLANLITALYCGKDKIFFECPIYMPKIGCGLGGLNWEKDVQHIIEFWDKKIDNDVYICEL